MKQTFPKFMVIVVSASLLLSACRGQATPEGEQDVPVVVDDLAVSAEGRLVPRQFVQLSLSIGGRVAEVLVAEGDQIETGQVLARLENQEQLTAAVASAKLELLSAEQALEVLNTNASLATAEAQLALAQAENALEDTLRKMGYTRNPLGKAAGDAVEDAQLNYDTALANLQLTQAGPLAQAVNSARDAANQAFSLYQDAQAHFDECNGCNKLERDALQTAYENAQSQLAVAQLQLDTALATQNNALGKAQDQLQTAESNLAALEAGPDELKVTLAEAEVAVADARLASARSSWEELQGGPDPDSLALAESRLENAGRAKAAAEAAFADLELRAPFAGSVADLTLKVGEQLAPGQVVLVLADFSGWIIETDNLTEIEVPQVSIGQAVEVKFDALPELSLPGKVAFISPLFESKRGDITYTAQIELQAFDPRLQWGMTAVATFQK